MFLAARPLCRGMLGLAILAGACSAPHYEVHRLPAGETAWRHCAPGADREQRLASWCPGPVILGSDADISSGERVLVELGAHPELTGPLMVAADTVTYVPVRLDIKFEALLHDLLLQANPRSTVWETNRQIPGLRARVRRQVHRITTLPPRIEVRLPRRRSERRAGWTVRAWPGGRRTERVSVTIPRVPAEARLAISFAIAEAGGYRGGPDVTFRVETATGQLLWSKRVAAWAPRQTGAWHDAEIPLPAFDGQPLELRFVAAVEGDADAFSYPVWGKPALLAPTAASPDPRPNVLLVSLDTLRGDVLSLAGRATPIMPSLDGFAAEGVSFSQAYATFPSTTGSHMTMMTSLHPCAHGVVMLDTTLSPRATTLAEAFAASGWATAAITEDALIKGDVGFARGFDRYVDQLPHGKPLGIFGRGISRALRWLARDADRRFFLFLHTYQPHEPYKVPPHLRDRFPIPSDANEFDRFRVDYEAGARYTDELLARLLRALRRRGLLETTLVVITSDHGQAFGEHGVHGHGTDVFDEALRVPLVFHHPALAAGGRRVDGPVSLLDLAPTLLDAARIESPQSFEGRSLLPLLRGDAAAPPRSKVFSENLWGARMTAYRGPLRTYIETSAGIAVYDRTHDTGDRRDLASSQESAVQFGRTQIAEFIKDCKRTRVALRAPSAPVAAPIDPATRDALRALGYVK